MARTHLSPSPVIPAKRSSPQAGKARAGTPRESQRLFWSRDSPRGAYVPLPSPPVTDGGERCRGFHRVLGCSMQARSPRRQFGGRVNWARMRANAIAADEQSRRLSVPEIGESLALDKLLGGWSSSRRLIFCDETGQAPLAAQAMRDAGPGAWAIIIG